MMKTSIWFGIGAVMLVWLTACQKMTEEETDGQASQMLAVKARSADYTDLRYPVRVYAFKENGECADMQVLAEADDEMGLCLPSGNYQVVAVSDPASDYAMPEAPKLQDEITMKSVYGAKVPLMMGKADVVVNKREATVDLTMAYVVTAVEVALKEVPADVQSVKLTLSSLYSSLTFGGLYGGETHKLEIPCTLDTENIWSASAVYAFPGCGEETVLSIELQKKDSGKETYAYTYKGVPAAGHPFHISGNYMGDVAVGGRIIVQGWGTPTEVDFDFGGEDTGSGNEDEETTEGTPGENGTTNATPQVGTVWNNAIVVETVGNEVLLMSLEQWNVTIAEVDGILQEYDAAGTGWHVPTFEEAQLLKATFGGSERMKLNENIGECSGDLPEIDGEERYLCDKEGVYYSFIFAGGTTISKAGNKRSYYTRLLKRQQI